MRLNSIIIYYYIKISSRGVPNNRYFFPSLASSSPISPLVGLSSSGIQDTCLACDLERNTPMAMTTTTNEFAAAATLPIQCIRIYRVFRRVCLFIQVRSCNIYYIQEFYSTVSLHPSSQNVVIIILNLNRYLTFLVVAIQQFCNTKSIRVCISPSLYLFNYLKK